MATTAVQPDAPDIPYQGLSGRQIRRAQRILDRAGSDKTLGQVLLELGDITPAEFDRVQGLSNGTLELVDLLVRAKDEIVEQLQFQIGYTTLKSWNLEEDICEAARAICPDSRRAELAVTTIVRASDVIAQKLGLHPFPDRDLELMDDDVIESLDLSDIELAALLVDLEDEIQEVYTALSA